jgi:hypothetical protein
MSDNPYANMEQYRVIPSAPTGSTPNAPIQNSNPYANMEQYKHVAKEPYNPLDVTANTSWDLAKDAGKAVVRAGASILDLASPMGGLPYIFDEPSTLPQGKPDFGTTHAAAKEALPYKHNILGETMEGAAMGAAFPGGPLTGAIVGGIASGGTEAIKENFPKAPLTTQIGLTCKRGLESGN